MGVCVWPPFDKSTPRVTVTVTVTVCAGYCSDSVSEKYSANTWVQTQRDARLAQAERKMEDIYYQHVEQVLSSLKGADQRTCNQWFSSEAHPREKTTATIRLAVRLALSRFCLVQMGVTSFKSGKLLELDAADWDFMKAHGLPPDELERLRSKVSKAQGTEDLGLKKLVDDLGNSEPNGQTVRALRVFNALAVDLQQKLRHDERISRAAQNTESGEFQAAMQKYDFFNMLRRMQQLDESCWRAYILCLPRK